MNDYSFIFFFLKNLGVNTVKKNKPKYMQIIDAAVIAIAEVVIIRHRFRKLPSRQVSRMVPFIFILKTKKTFSSHSLKKKWEALLKK